MSYICITKADNLNFKIVQKSLDGQTVFEHNSPTDAEKSTGISASHIVKCCKGKRGTAGGYKWVYQKYESFTEASQEVDLEKGTLRSNKVVDFEPKDDLELAALHKVNLDKYKISTYWSKLRPDGKYTSSILAALKKVDDISSEDIVSLLKNYKSDYVPFKNSDLLINRNGERCCAFIDITDFHLDKRDIKDTPVEQRVEEYFKVLTNLLVRSHNSYKLEKIAFVLNSDMLHVDTFFGTTTKGTPQEYSIRWHEAFATAFDIYVKSINQLKQFCEKLDIISVLGNHARVSEFHLAFALSKYFDKEKNITFDISPDPRKIYLYGETFIGLHHGNTKIMDLPLVFAKEFNKEWGQCKYHEVKVGDQHHYMEKDYKGVLVKQLPALCGTDTWHNDHNYVNSVKAAICTIYEHDKGRIADLQERL